MAAGLDQGALATRVTSPPERRVKSPRSAPPRAVWQSPGAKPAHAPPRGARGGSNGGRALRARRGFGAWGDGQREHRRGSERRGHGGLGDAPASHQGVGERSGIGERECTPVRTI